MREAQSEADLRRKGQIARRLLSLCDFRAERIAREINALQHGAEHAEARQRAAPAHRDAIPTQAELLHLWQRLVHHRVRELARAAVTYFARVELEHLKGRAGGGERATKHDDAVVAELGRAEPQLR